MPVKRFAAVSVLAVCFCVAPRVRATNVAPPKLAVVIVVDQMRADYVDRFKAEWTSGLKRMVGEGAWFQRVAYPYLTTVTCAGHATVSTGAFPHAHGIIQNLWWDRDTRSPITCTSDDDAQGVNYGASAVHGESASRLLTPTFADVLRSERNAHVATVSLKARSAIMLAGHGGDAALWLNDSLDGWASSSAFGETPSPALMAIVDGNPIDADYGKTWDRLLPADRYHETDDGEGEAPPTGWTRTFPHELKSASGQPDAVFHTLWERSPFADAYVGRIAALLVESLQLGKHETTDVLGVSFSSTDLVGHAFGPDSQEVHDMYLQLDRTIGTLLDRLDVLVGPGNYVVGLTADHGVTAIPEQITRAGKDGGRLNATAIQQAIEASAQSALGPGKYVSIVNANDVYFEPGMYAKLAAAPAAMKAVLDAIRHTRGIADVFRAEDMRLAAGSKNALLRAAALSYFEGRSGDLILVPKAGWMFSLAGTTHGTASADDQRVPILFFGAGIKHGVFTEPATPADVTPTLAAIVGARMPAAEGHALTPALDTRAQSTNPHLH
jgi:predicted AlkP superfamily pyrophosphatase or phosphodiesterase